MKPEKNKNKEVHTVTFEAKNVKEQVSDNGVVYGYFEGYAAAFGNLDGNYDVIEKGSFLNSLSGSKEFPLLFQHDYYQVLGKITEAREDSYGLYVKGRLNLGVPKAKEVYSLLKAGDMDRMSIGFRTVKCEWKENGDDYYRVLQDVDLKEISIVTFPANDNAVVTDIKSVLIDNAESIRDIEKFLRCKGLSSKESQAVISEVKSLYAKEINKSDSYSEKDVRDEHQTKSVGKAEEVDKDTLEAIQSFINKFKE